MQTLRAFLLVFVVGACAVVPSRHHHGLTTIKAGDTTSHGGHEFETLALAMLVVLVLIPIVTRRR